MRSRNPDLGVRRPDRAGHAGALLCAMMACAPPASADAQPGQVQCVVTANGAPARGSITIVGPGTRRTGGTCASPIRMDAGTWKATVRLDGALDNPAEQVEVKVASGKTTRVAVDFQVGRLEVQILARGRSGTGVVTVSRGKERIGTLGAGVTAQLSAGTYEVVVSYGGKEKRYSVKLQAGQRRMVRAQF